jgi:hypothetical protein
MAGLDEIAKLLGLGTPFLYAGAVYGLFYWLNENLSDDAKHALSRLLQVEDYDQGKVSAAIVEIFDRVYTKPLLSWHALFRSMLLTLAVTVIYLYEVGSLGSLLGILKVMFGTQIDFLGIVHIVTTIFIVSMLLNLLSDYASLFIIRPILQFSGKHPAATLFAGVGAACIVVLVFIGARFVILEILLGADTLDSLGDKLNQVYFRDGKEAFLGIPAIIVFSWILLLGLAIALLRMVKPLSHATSTLRWLLKDGKDHPLVAVGYVAGAIVFFVSAIWQYAIKA